MEHPKTDAITDRYVDENAVDTPVQPKFIHRLDQLINGITPENQHAEISFDPAVGREVF